MTPVPEPQVDELTPAGMSFASLVRGSLFHLLNERLRAPPNAVSARVLKSIRDALQDDRIDVALRHVDRAWRQLPEHSATFAPIYGRLLSLEATDFNAALGLLRCAVDFAPDPDAAALTVHALLRLQRAQEARREFNLALADYCVEPGGLLARAGGEILKHAGLDAPGWIGRGPNLEVVGELAANEPNVLEISIDGGTRFTQILPHLRPEGGRLFTFDPPQPGMRIRLGVRSRGTELLGSNADARDDFLLDGRTESRGRRLTGWARIGWSPAKPVALRLEDETGRSAEIRTRDVADPSWRWPFAVDLNAAKLSGNRIHVSAQLPDGRWQPLPDSPLLLEPALRAGHKPLPLTRWKANATRSRLASHVVKRAKTIDVIIPVYGGRDETLSCIDAVLASIGDDARLVVVDDASDDPTLSTALDELEADGNIQLLRNVQNQGFVASVNRGLQLHPTHDAVVLNSDTLVFGDWLARLRAAAYSAPTVGTVTPLSNSGSIASYPRAAGSAIDPQSAAALHALAASTLPQTRVEIPVGVGFCLYIRRDCLRDVGELDAAMFGKGYGEETDFCLRARHRGWSHRLAADVFVYHAGGISFGGRRQALLDRSQRLLNLRHPGYDRFIASFLARDPLHPARRRLDERRLLAFEGRFVLLVTLALAGGVDRYVTERSRVLKAQGLVPLVLRPATVGTADRSELWTDVLELPNLQFDVPQELPALVALLGALCIDAVEIQHFLHLDARLIEAVRALSIPYDVVIHDYSWICPRVTLIDGTNRYCGEPEVSVCQACVRRNGSKLGEKISVPALRARSATWLKGARQVTAPSADTAARMQRYFDALTVEVRPHAEKIVPAPLPVRTARRTTLRVALIGAIGTHKGYRILLDCARDARARRLPIEFVVIGHTENDAPLLATGKVFVTGQYSEAEAPHLIQREQPDMAWLPSVWPETWCYTLDHALNAGLPVAAFDVGAIAERLQTMGAADLMPLELDAPRINDRLLEFGGRQHQRDFTIVDSEQRLVQPLVKTPVPHSGDDATMSDNTADEMFMTKASNGTSAAQPLKSAAQPVKDEGLSASVQVLPLPKGLYLFSVKAAGPPPASNGGPLSLPAMHVGLGPGVRPDQVEFIAGPSTYGAWLFSAGDLLVTKVNGSGATLILTSVRAPGGETLSIKVERLEDRGEGIAAAAPAAPVKAPALPTRTNGAAAAKKEKGKPVFDSTGSPLPLPVQIGTHIRTRGDMNFANVPWAGRVAPGLWIESFAVLPLEHFGPQDIEYKGLTGSGFETPWMSDNQMCGTKGMATPLVGFAIRLKPSPAAAAFDCEYSGYFQSGITVGPLRNGAPCRSSVANDSLEGIQVRIVKRASTTVPEAARKGDSKDAVASKPMVAKPVVRKPAVTKAVPPKRSSTIAHHTANRNSRSTRRQPARRP